MNQQTHLLRSDLYRLLSAAVSYPDDNVYSKLNILSTGLCDSKELSEDLVSLIVQLKNALPTPEEIRKEYSRIFISGGLTLNESSVTSRFNAVSDTNAFYAAFGFAPKTGESPDSLMYELEFFALLHLKAALAETEEQHAITYDAMGKFLNDHVGDFAIEFSQKLKQGDALPFYMIFADLLRATLLEEMTQFNLQTV